MRVLFLATHDIGDFRSGAAQRNNNIRDAIERIAEVDTIVLTSEEAPVVRSKWGAERLLKVATAHGAGRRQRMRAFATTRRLVHRAVAERDYDFIVARRFGKAALVPIGLFGTLIVDADDMRQSVVGKPLTARLALGARAAAMRFVARRAFHIWLVDPRDHDTLDLARTRHSILPNTSKRRQQTAATAVKSGRRLLMVGFYNYPPNEEGLTWFARHVLPRVAAEFPDVELHAVGSYYQPALDALGDHVRMRGFVDDLGAEYAQADVVVCPILSGSGTQIKVIEALMHGRPTVVSAFSYQGFADVLSPDAHLLVAATAEDWVRQIGKMLRDPAGFADMAREGRRVAEIAYAEETFKDRVTDTLLGAISSR